MTRLVLVALVVALCLPIAAWGKNAPAASGKPVYQDVPPIPEPPTVSVQRPVGESGWVVRQPHTGKMKLECASATPVLPQPQMVERLATELSLSDEQMRNLAYALQTAQSKLEPLRTKFNDAVAALHRAVFSPEKNAAAVRQAAGSVRKAEEKLAAAELDAWLEIRPIFKEDQLKKLGESMGGAGGRGGPAPGELVVDP